MRKFLKAYRSFRPFTDEEAWTLFKLAAIIEACGWTLLITGILVSRYVTPGSNIAVLLAGRTHGALFSLYILAVIVLAPSLRWSWPRTIIAGAASVPPYGSLLFELWAAEDRRHARYRHLNGLLAYHLLTARLQGFDAEAYTGWGRTG
jgi:integral membrane protein